ncbi:MAG: hypothetical protein AAF789_10110 [Bacteroidota bacterium]
MKKRKIKYLLDALTSSESEYFLRWLQSELYDKQIFVQQLAEILIKEAGMEDEAIWQRLYPERPFDDARLRKLMSDLRRWVHEFMAIQAFRKDEAVRHKYLLDACNQMSIREEFIRQYRRVAALETQFEQLTPIQDILRWKYDLTIEEQWFQVKGRIREIPGLKNEATKGINIQETIQGRYLEAVLHESLALYLSLSTQPGLRSTKEIQHLIAIIQLLIPKDTTQSSHKLRLFLAAFECAEAPSQEKLKALITGLKLSVHTWAYADLNLLFGFLFNQLNRVFAQTRDSASFVMLRDFFIWGMDEKILLVDGVLPPSAYRNLITFCVRTQAYDTAQYYLLSYKSYLPQSVREETFVICQALIWAYTGKYSDLLRKLSISKFSIEPFEVNARWLIVQAHHELYPEEIEWRLQQVEKHQRYVKNRKQLHPQFQKAYLNQFRFYRRILMLTGTAQLQRVVKDLQATNPFHNKGWLVKILNQISNPQSQEVD